MNGKRKHSSAPEKVAILRLHLLEKKPVSDLGDQYGIQPTLFDRWQKEFFENGAAAFEQTGKRRQVVEEVKDRKIAALERKLQQKNEVLAELMQEDVQRKKELGEPCKASGFPTTRVTKSWISSTAGPARRASPCAACCGGSAWAAASGTTGNNGTARSMSTTLGFHGIIGWKRPTRRPSWPSTTSIPWKGIGGGRS